MQHLYHRPKSGDSSVQLSLIVTPMLDMAFQLMAFFIMTYHPSALEAHLDGTLLPPEKVAIVNPDQPLQKKDTDPLSSDQTPDLKETIQVIVNAVARGQKEGNLTEGQPTKIALKLPESSKEDKIDVRIADADTDFPIAMKRLKQELEKLQKRGGASKTKINVTADGELRYVYFIGVQDACRAAKFTNIGFTAPLTK